MKRRTSRVPLAVVLALFMLFLLSACQGGKGPDLGTPPPEGQYQVHPIFYDFYMKMGERTVLGPAISQMVIDGPVKYQYVAAGRMELDTSAVHSEQYRFAPLGRDMNVAEPSVMAPYAEEGLYVNGHIIYKGFKDLYDRLGGARSVGLPLTELHYNSEKRAFEQYFENLGFYWSEDTPDQVRLLAYGSWKCAELCSYLPDIDSGVPIPYDPPVPDQTFKQAIARLGPEFIGFALSEPFIGMDGRMEQVFSHMVMVADPNSATGVTFRPLPSKIGILTDQLVAAVPLEGMAFWPLDGNLGHNIPQTFLDYITMHGGIEISGPPIGEPFLFASDVFRQCFTNLCLDYIMRSSIPEALRIQPAQLGYAYFKMYYHKRADGYMGSQSFDAITLQVWERYSFISSGQAQEVGVLIYQGSEPLKNIEPVLIVTLPDSSKSAYHFPPTGTDGKTYRTLTPIDGPNGQLIPYQVCISSILNETFCVGDSFVIWYNP